MLYRAPKGSLMWDTWLFPWEGQFHLFYLDTTQELGPWGQLGHAVSDDLLTWTDCEPIAQRGGPGEWDRGSLMTGMTLWHDGRFWTAYGSDVKGYHAYGLLVSDDLHHWEKLPQNPVIVPAAPYVSQIRGHYSSTGWTDPYITWREDLQLYEAVLRAQLDTYDEDDLGACIGRIRSKDLIHWETASPAVSLGQHFTMCEVPEYFEFEGRHYLTFNSTPHCGHRINTPSRNDCTGVFYVVADGRDGPYRLPADPFLMGAGGYRIDGYCGRTVAVGEERLYYHHIDAFLGDYHVIPEALGAVWGTPKVLAATSCGDLFLRRWPKLDELREETLVRGVDKVGIEAQNARGIARWDMGEGRLHGISRAVCSMVELPVLVSDFEICCKVEMSAGVRATIAFRTEPGRPHGSGLALDAGQGMIEIVHLIPSSPGPMSFPIDRARWPLDPGRAVEVRILARDDVVEVYLDDRWAFTTVTANKPHRCNIVPQPYLVDGHAPRQGHLGFAVEDGEAVFSGLEVHRLRPLA